MPKLPDTSLKIIKIVLILAIGVSASYYYLAGSARRPSAVDAEVLRMTAGIKPGMARSAMTGIITGGGFKLDDRSPPKKDPLHRQVFVRSASRSTFAWVRYDILVEYDGDDRLKTARFLKSGDSKGRDTSCLVLHEVPAAHGPYPLPCPSNIHDF